MTNRFDKIELHRGQWCVFSEDGQTNLGCYDTEAEAVARLRQIEGHKNDSPGESSQAANLASPSLAEPRIATPRDGALRLAPQKVYAKTDGWVSRCDFLGPIQFVDEGAEIELEFEPNAFQAKLTPEGFLKIEGHISGTGIYEYSDGNETWGELRTPEEVFAQEALDSFKGVVVTDDHPSQMVTVDNVKAVQAGHLGSNVRPAKDGIHVAADMVITDSDLIRKIKNGKTQLSCGYEALVTQDSGVSDDGTPYSYRQTDIRGNHLSVVDLARGGPTCRLLFDAVGISVSGDSTMKVKRKNGKIMIGETEHEVPDEVAAAFEMMKNKVEEQGAELSKLAAEGDNADEMMEEEEMAMKDAPDILKVLADSLADKGKKDKKDEPTIEQLKAQVDTLSAALEEQKKNSHVNVDARVQLVQTAKDVLGNDTKTDGISDIALMRQVICKVTPAMDSKVGPKAKPSDDYVRAAYDMALQAHVQQQDSTTSLMALTFEANRGDNKDADIDALYNKYCDGLRNRSEQREAN